MPSAQNTPSRRRSSKSFRVGKVRAFLRGQVWYLCYYEQGRRLQPRVGPDRAAAQKMAAEINAQLEVGLPSAFGFEPISFSELQLRWLEHHENVRRSSIRTIERYRAATNHLLRFIDADCPIRRVSEFRSSHAEKFVQYLRAVKTAPNGHPRAVKRRLRDNSVKYILETCSTMLNYAQRHRHLSAYADNPFRVIEISRIPVEDAKPIIAFDTAEEQRLLDACDDWQFPIFLTLLLTGLRPGELTHLLLPDDVDLPNGWLRIRNKFNLGWRVKTRSERDIPLHPTLCEVIRILIGDRNSGPVFRQRRCSQKYQPPLAGRTPLELNREVVRRVVQHERLAGGEMTRREKSKIATTVWRDIGALREDWIRTEFMRVTSRAGLHEITAPKTCRHAFATMLQDANIDPLIRNELMGHAPTNSFGKGDSLGTTGIYTHTRPETKRSQLESALRDRPALLCAANWLSRQCRGKQLCL